MMVIMVDMHCIDVWQAHERALLAANAERANEQTSLMLVWLKDGMRNKGCPPHGAPAGLAPAAPTLLTQATNYWLQG